jgi:hypothetical protein
LAKLTLPVPTRCVKELLAVVSPPSSPLLFGGEDNVHSTHIVSSPTMLVHAVCQALKARPLPAGPVGSKDAKGNDGKDNGDTGGGSQELDHALDQDGPPLSTPSSGMTAMRKVSK